MHTWFPNLPEQFGEHGHDDLDKVDIPIPMTVPYSLFFAASCAETAGHRQMSAKKAKRIRESDDAMRRDLTRDGRRCGLVIAVDDVEMRGGMMMFMEKEPFFILITSRATYRKCVDTSTL